MFAVCAYFNPQNSKTLQKNYKKFRRSIRIPIITVEVAYNSQPFFISDSIKIRANETHILWQKERLLNIAIEKVPKSCDKIVWLDTDIIFENQHWVKQTSAKLDSYPVVQPFDTVYEIPDINSTLNAISYGKFRHIENDDKQLQYYKDKNINTWPSIGMAWAFRKEAIPNGLFDVDVVGCGDVLQLLAWTGKWSHQHIKQMNPLYRKFFLNWAWNTYEAVQDRIGFTDGKIRHLFHGKQESRKYQERKKYLYNFDPNKDIYLDANNLYKWNTNNSTLHQYLIDYFLQRREDHETKIFQKNT